MMFGNGVCLSKTFNQSGYFGMNEFHLCENPLKDKRLLQDNCLLTNLRSNFKESLPAKPPAPNGIKFETKNTVKE